MNIAVQWGKVLLGNPHPILECWCWNVHCPAPDLACGYWAWEAADSSYSSATLEERSLSSPASCHHLGGVPVDARSISFFVTLFLDYIYFISTIFRPGTRHSAETQRNLTSLSYPALSVVGRITQSQSKSLHGHKQKYAWQDGGWIGQQFVEHCMGWHLIINTYWQGAMWCLTHVYIIWQSN